MCGATTLEFLYVPIFFNSILKDAGFALGAVRLLRHQEKLPNRMSPYRAWRDNRAAFESYQSMHKVSRSALYAVPNWASFVVTPEGKTLFAGVYDAKLVGPNTGELAHPVSTKVFPAGTMNLYETTLRSELSDLIGRLHIDWGPAARAWVQRPDRQNKVVTEVRRTFSEPSFPGFTRFIQKLSDLENLPSSWIEVLRSSKGVYLLSCPRTREQYIGAAYGNAGFWDRWLTYASDGHGGNVGLRSRERSDYQISILEVAGSAASNDDILGMEALWKEKLQSRQMGLNHN
jgi:hypothetical protein